MRRDRFCCIVSRSCRSVTAKDTDPPEIGPAPMAAYPMSETERNWIMATVQDTVLEYIRREVVPDRRIAYDTSLISLGFVNSLQMVTVKTYLEKQYRIRIPDELATREAFDSVECITRLLGKLGVR